MQDTLSFFDVEDRSAPVFAKIPDLPPLNPAEMILSNVFYIMNNDKKIELQLLSLTAERLYFAKPNETPYKCFELHLKRFKIVNNTNMIATLNKSIKNPVLFNFAFVFLNLGETLEILTSDIKLFKKWKQVLVHCLIQHTFHEDFNVIKMIGKGSFAKVYLAQKKENNKHYAVKAFNKEFLKNNTNKGKAALINEIAITKQLDHPNIIKIYEVYETTHSIYLVMDLVTGGDLLQKLSKNEKYRMTDIKKIMRTFLEILNYIHSRKIMHRDLKPENILLRSENEEFDIVIADFGLSTRIDNSSILFHHCGTPGFIAPEVLNYSKNFPFYNEKCDIYSVGVIFYILLTGKKPFYSKDLKTLIELNKNSTIDFNEPELLILPLEAVDLLKKMLNYNPAMRYSAEDCLKHNFFAEPPEDNIFTFTNSEWTSYMEKQIEMMSTNNPMNNSILYSGQSPLAVRQPVLNGRTNTIESSDISPNITQHKLDIDLSNNSSKFAIANNTGPYQQAIMNTMFASNHLRSRNLKFELGSPKREVKKNASHLLEESFDRQQTELETTFFFPPGGMKNRAFKKFTCLPKLITPIACEEVEEEEKKISAD